VDAQKVKNCWPVGTKCASFATFGPYHAVPNQATIVVMAGCMPGQLGTFAVEKQCVFTYDQSSLTPSLGDQQIHSQSPEFATLRDQVKIVLSEGNSVYAAVPFAITFRDAVHGAAAPPCPWCFIKVIG
jgi:hypothetical protein